MGVLLGVAVFPLRIISFSHPNCCKYHGLSFYRRTAFQGTDVRVSLTGHLLGGTLVVSSLGLVHINLL